MSQQVEFRQLRYFVVLARELHFGRAAARLNIAQPALSQHIRGLEKQMGVQLLVRSTRHVEVTPAGLAFLKDAELILTRVEEAVATAQTIAGHRDGLLRLGAIYSATFSFLPAVLQRFRSRFPEMRVEVEGMRSRQVVTALEKGEIHIGFLRPPQEPGHLRVATLFRERLVAVMQDTHPLAARTSLRLADLAGQTLLRLNRPDLRGAFQDLEALFAERGLQFESEHVATSTLSVLSLIASGGGLAFVPDWVRGMPWHGITTREVEDLPVGIDLSIAWRADDPRPAIDSFVETARRLALTQGPEPLRPR